jgi:Fe-S-cluster containining protein
MVAVPCNGCRACCQGGSKVPVLTDHGDKLELYQTHLEVVPHFGLRPVLDRKPNGDCVYLGESGCTIHDHCPVTCQEFDCRGWFLKFDRKTRRRLSRNPLQRTIFTAGRKRLDEADNVTQAALRQRPPGRLGR